MKIYVLLTMKLFSVYGRKMKRELDREWCAEILLKYAFQAPSFRSMLNLMLSALDSSFSLLIVNCHAVLVLI